MGRKQSEAGGPVPLVTGAGGAAVYLTSDDAAYVTGQSLNVCGGLEMR